MSKILMEKDGVKENQVPVTQSKYVLAKYGIQVVDPPFDQVPVSITSAGKQEVEEAHYHPGPRAIECKVDAGKIGCDRDSWMRLLWCYLFPCALMESCFVYLCDCCCECISSCFKRMEEKYTFECCDRFRCCRVEEN